GRLIPFAVFTEPEIAGVGMGEKEASEEGHDIKTQKFYFAHHGRALAIDKLDGFIKLIVDRSNGKLLGGHIIGPSAGEIIHELAMAIRMGAAVNDLRDMMHIHPTLTEALNSAAWAG
ncbi:MAG TPA: dihydrolipoyl dehydrogenase, partial [Firmicutes bacterium]|nr:dihydrolipoyl dehydrogenase [Bacillota bacterium]